MRLGYVMRQQVVAAIHAKVLRLNSASVAYASTGARPRHGMRCAQQRERVRVCDPSSSVQDPAAAPAPQPPQHPGR